MTRPEAKLPAARVPSIFTVEPVTDEQRLLSALGLLGGEA